MPSLKVNDDIEFTYTDNGAPATENYKTLIIIHGHTFHSGSFQRLNDPAASQSVRLICVNRREYCGSTLLNEDQLRIFASGTDDERTKLIAQLGFELALFVDALITKCSLPKSGGVTITAWSLGNLFMVSLLSALSRLPATTKEHLASYIKGIILWDPPSQALGITSPPNSYVLLSDETLPAEERGKVFGVWVASYWKHGDLSTHDFNQLEQRKADPSKAASTSNMTLEQLLQATDFAPGDRCDTLVVAPEFKEVLEKQTKILLDPDLRALLNRAKFTYLFCDNSPWNIIYGAWVMENRVKEANNTQTHIDFKVMKGANHFLMWDEPEIFMKELLSCMEY
ncbi:hypothetical protein M422DRAFT_23445 [Sphaerobolus stellatus SS14]|nr:hypothetical protein M422DRAFT_23445 [Sphaerobolus stellatus SS14]